MIKENDLRAVGRVFGEKGLEVLNSGLKAHEKALKTSKEKSGVAWEAVEWMVKMAGGVEKVPAYYEARKAKEEMDKELDEGLRGVEKVREVLTKVEVERITG